MKPLRRRPVPSLPVLAVRVDDLGEKEAVLAAGHAALSTIPHFDGYAAVLIEMRLVGKRVLRQVLEDGWAAARAGCAPGRARPGRR